MSIRAVLTVPKTVKCYKIVTVGHSHKNFKPKITSTQPEIQLASFRSYSHQALGFSHRPFLMIFMFFFQMGGYMDEYSCCSTIPPESGWTIWSGWLKMPPIADVKVKRDMITCVGLELWRSRNLVWCRMFSIKRMLYNFGWWNPTWEICWNLVEPWNTETM